MLLAAMALSFSGLALFAFVPQIFSDIMTGLVIATVVFSISSGALEVMISPIIDNIPKDAAKKGPVMSLMHSFYAWGQALVIIVTTLYLLVAGDENWQYILLLWTFVPVVTFCLFVCAPIAPGVAPETRTPVKKILLQSYCLVAFLAIAFGGATEVVMNQWISTFAEKGLSFSKLAADLGGMCLFALFLGLGRMLYGVFGKRISVSAVCFYGSLTSLGCYLAAALCPVPVVSILFATVCGFTSSLLWPGTLVIASERFPQAGGWLFAALAVSGDVGAAAGPLLTGVATDASLASGWISGLADTLGMSATQVSLRFGLLVSALFPLACFACHAFLRRKKKQSDAEQEDARADQTNLSEGD